jgi:hypothetical protein
MDLRHKHHALIWVIALILVFVAATAWHVARPVSEPQPEAAPSPVGISDAVETVTITRSGPFFEAEGRYPATVPLPGEAGAVATARLRGFVERKIDEFIEVSNVDALSPEDIQTIFPDGRKYQLEIDYAISTGARTVSYAFSVLSDTFGAHPNVSDHTITFDTRTGEPIALPDLFLPDRNPYELLSALARAELPAVIAARAGGDSGVDWMLADGTEPSADNFSAWVIDGNSLVLLFQRYQVGPGVLGSIELSLPLASLSEHLRPEFRL